MADILGAEVMIEQGTAHCCSAITGEQTGRGAWMR